MTQPSLSDDDYSPEKVEYTLVVLSGVMIRIEVTPYNFNLPAPEVLAPFVPLLDDALTSFLEAVADAELGTSANLHRFTRGSRTDTLHEGAL